MDDRPTPPSSLESAGWIFGIIGVITTICVAYQIISSPAFWTVVLAPIAPALGPIIRWLEHGPHDNDALLGAVFCAAIVAPVAILSAINVTPPRTAR